MLHGIRQLHALHGPIGAVQDGGQRVVFLFSPEFNQQVLSDTDRYAAHFFAVRGPKKSAQRRLTHGLLSMNGQQHRRNRRLVKEPFSRRAIATYSETVSSLTDDMLATWKVGQQLDIAEEMRRYMLRVTSTLLFGFEDAETAYRLGDKLAVWVEMNDALGAGALVPNESFSEGYEELLSFADTLEEEIMQMIRRRRESRKFGGDVLSILVRSYDEEGSLSDAELVGQSAVLFGAAHMTTAHSLCWTLLLLAQHPSVMSQLWDELQRTDPQDETLNESAAEHGHCLDTDGPQSSSLLENIIKESMRLLPASAYSQRINTEPVQLGPFRLPRGTGIVFTPLVTHHLPDLYPEPERFLPDRWITLRPSPYAYHPFGAGARMCIGGPLALAIIRIALQKILTRFRLKVIPGADINAQVRSTMLVPIDGVPMLINEADCLFESSAMTGNIHELVDFYEVPATDRGGTQAAAPPGPHRSAAPRRPR